jgi:hypothetical protein
MIPSGIVPVFHISQYDKGRELSASVYFGVLPVNLDNYTVTVEATRNDGVAIVTAVETSNNNGTFEVTPTMSNVVGKYYAQLVIVNSNSKRIASLPFAINVIKAAMDENAEAIEEDASLYQQYTDATQSLMAKTKNDLLADIANEALTRQNADNALQANINAEITARSNAIAGVYTALSNEANARSQSDVTINARIDNIVAPSGAAPSEAEITDARVGSDGIIYPNLGTAIRTQVGNLKGIMSDFFDFTVYDNTSSYVQNVALNANATTSPSTNYKTLVKIPVKPLSKLYITGVCGVNNSGALQYVFADINGNNIVNTGYTTRTIETHYKKPVTVPSNAYYVSVCFRIATVTEFFVELQNLKADISIPEMYGAKGDGVTDDTNALKTVFALGNNILLTGKYKVSESIYIPNNVNVFGGTIISAATEDEHHIFEVDKTGIKVRFDNVRIESSREYPLYLNVSHDVESNTIGSNNIFISSSKESQIEIENCSFLYLSVAYLSAPNKLYIRNCNVIGCEMFIWSGHGSTIISKCNHIEVNTSGVGMGLYYHIYYCVGGSTVYSNGNTIISQKMYNDVYHPFIASNHSEDSYYTDISNINAIGDTIEGLFTRIAFGNYHKTILESVNCNILGNKNDQLLKGIGESEFIINNSSITSKTWSAVDDDLLVFNNTSLNIDLSGFNSTYVTFFGKKHVYKNCNIKIKKDGILFKFLGTKIYNSIVEVDGECDVFRVTEDYPQAPNTISPITIESTIFYAIENTVPQESFDETKYMLLKNIFHLKTPLFSEVPTSPKIQDNIFLIEDSTEDNTEEVTEENTEGNIEEVTE